MLNVKTATKNSRINSSLITLFLLFALCSSLFAQNGPAASANVYTWGVSAGGSNIKWNQNTDWTPTTPSNNGPQSRNQFVRIDDTYNNYTVSPAIQGMANVQVDIGGASIEYQSGVSQTSRTLTINGGADGQNDALVTVPNIRSAQPSNANGLLFSGNVEIYSAGLTVESNTGGNQKAGLMVYSAINCYNTNTTAPTPTITVTQWNGSNVNTIGGIEIYAFSNWSGVNTYANSTTGANFYCNSISFFQGAGIASQYYASTVNGTMTVGGNFQTGLADPTLTAVSNGNGVKNGLGGYGGLMVYQNATLRMATNSTLQIYALTIYGNNLTEDHSKTLSTTNGAATGSIGYIDTWTNTPNTIQMLSRITLQYQMSFYNWTIGDGTTTSFVLMNGNVAYTNLTIDANATLDTNGYSLTMVGSGSFTNNGTLTTVRQPNGPAAASNVQTWGSSGGGTSSTWATNSTSVWTPSSGSNKYPGQSAPNFARVDDTYINSTNSPALTGGNQITIGGMNIETQVGAGLSRSVSINGGGDSKNDSISVMPNITAAQPQTSAGVLMSGNVEIYSGALNVVSNSNSGGASGALKIGGSLNGYNTNSTSTISISNGSGNTVGGIEIYAFSNWSGVDLNMSSYPITTANFSADSMFFAQGAGVASQYYASVVNNNLTLTGGWQVGSNDPVLTAVNNTVGTKNDLGGYGGLMVDNNATLRMGANSTLAIYALTIYGNTLAEDHSQSLATSGGAAAGSIGYIDTWTNTPNTINILANITTQYAMSFDYLHVEFPSTLTLGGNIYVNGDLTIDSGATLAAGGYTITVFGNIIDNGTLTTTGTVWLRGGGAHSISGSSSPTFSTLQIGDGTSTNSTTTISTAITATTLLLYANHNLNSSGSNITISSGGAMTLSNSGSTWNPGTGTVIWQTSGALPTYSNGTNAQFYNLTIAASGTVTPGDAISTLTIKNNLVINSGATFGNNTAYQISVGGNWTDNGSFASTNTTVTFTGAPGTILTNETFYYLTIATGATTQLQGGKTITVNNAGALTINGTLQGSTATLVTPSMTLGGSGAFNAASSTVKWQGTTGATIPAVVFNNLTIQHNTGTAVLGGNVTVNGALIIDSDNVNTQLDCSSHILTLNGDFTINSALASAFLPNTGSVTFSGSGQTISRTNTGTAAISFNAVTINETSSSGYVYLNYSATPTGLVTITTGALSVYNTGVLTLNSGIAVGDSSLTNGTTNAIFSPAAGSTVTFASGKAATIDYTGELVTSASTPYPVFNTSIGQFGLAIYGNSSVSGLTIQNINSAGAVMYFNGGATPANSNIVSFDNVNFNYAAPGLGVYAITFYAYNANNLTFTVNNTVFYTGIPQGGTVFFDGSAGQTRTITMLNTGGSSGGALNGDADDNSSTDRGAGAIAQITWIDPIYWYSFNGVSTAWDSTKNWAKWNGSVYVNAGVTPSLSSSVKVNSAITPPSGSVSPYPIITSTTSSTTLTVTSLALQNSGTLTNNGAALTLYGSFTIDPLASYSPNSASTTIFAGTAAQLIPGGTGSGQSYGNLQISNTSIGGASTNGSMTINGNLGIYNNATFTTSAAVYVDGNWAFYGANSIHNPQSASDIYFSGTSAQQISSDQASFTFSFASLEIDNSAGVSINTSSQSTLNISASFTIKGGAFSAGSNLINIGGDWKMLSSGTFTPSSSVITFNGSNSQRIYTDATISTVTFNELDITNASAGGIVMAIGGSGPTFVLNSHLKVGTGGQASTFNATNTTLKVAGNWQMGSSASFTNTGSQVILNGSSAQTITNGSTQFSQLQINSTNTVTLADSLTVQQVYIKTGTLSANGNNITANYSLGNQSISGAVSIYGTLTLGASTLTATSAQTLAYDVSGIATNGNAELYLDSGGTLNMTTGTIKLGGSGANQGALIKGTFNAHGASSTSVATINNSSPGSTPYIFTFSGATIYSEYLTFLNYAQDGVYLNNIPSISASVNGVKTSNELLGWSFSGQDSSISGLSKGLDVYVGNLSGGSTIAWTLATFSFTTGSVAGGTLNYYSISAANQAKTVESLKSGDAITMDQYTTSRSDGYTPSNNSDDPTSQITWTGLAKWTGGAPATTGNGDEWTANGNWSGAARGSTTDVIIYDIQNSGPTGGAGVWDCTGVNGVPSECKNLTINQTDINGNNNNDGGKISIDGTYDKPTGAGAGIDGNTTDSTLIVNGDVTIQDGAILDVGYLESGGESSTANTQNYTHLTVYGNWIDNSVYGGGITPTYQINGQKGFVQSQHNHAYQPPNGTTMGTSYSVCFGGVGKTYSGSSSFYLLWVGVPNFPATTYTDDHQNYNNETRTLNSGSVLTILAGGYLYVDTGAQLQGGVNATPATLYFNGAYSTGLYANWIPNTGAADWDPGNSLVKWQNGNALPLNQPVTNRSCFYDLEVGDGTNNYTVTMTHALTVYDNLTIKAGTTLKTNGNAITVGGNLTVESGANIIFNPWDLITFNSFTKTTQTVNAPQVQFQRVTLNQTTGTSLVLQLANSMDTYSQFTITNNETLNTSTYQFTQRDQCVYNNGVLTSSGTYLIAEAAASAAYAVPFTNFYNLNIAGVANSGVRLRANTTVTNNMTIQSGLIYAQDFAGTNFNLTVDGNWTDSTIPGTFQAGSGTATVTFASTAESDIYNSETFNNLTVAKTGAKTYFNATPLTNFLTINGKLLISSGTLDLGALRTGANAHIASQSAAGSVEVAGGTLNLNTSELLVSGASGGTLIDGGTLSMTSAGTSYYALDISGSNGLSMTSGTLDATSASPQVRVAGLWSITGGTFNIGTSDITFSGTTTANITTMGTTSGDFYKVDLTAAGAGVKTLKGTTYLASNLTFDSGAGVGILNATTAVNVYVAGNWNDVPGNSFASANTTVYFNGSTAQNVSAETFNNLVVSNSSNSVDVTANGNITVNTTLTVTAGNFNMGANLVTVSGAASPSVSVQSGKIKVSTGTMYVTNTSAGVNVASGATFSFTGAGTLEVYGNIVDNGTLDSTSQSALLYICGNWTQSGTFNVGASTVKFSTQGSGADSAITASNFNIVIVDKGATNNKATASSATININGVLSIYSGTFTTSTNTVNLASNLLKETSAAGTVYVGDMGGASGGLLSVTGNIGAPIGGTLALNFPVVSTTARLDYTGATTLAPTTLQAGQGTIRFKNTSTGQTIPNGYTYNNIDIANGTTVTATPNGNLTINGTLKVGVAGVASGTMGLSTYTGHTAANLRLENSGTLSLSSGMITVSGTVNDAAGAGATINFNTGTLASTSTTNSNFNSTNTTLNFNGTAGALWIYATPTFGTVSANNGTISYRGGNASQTAPLISYYTLEVNKTSGTVYASGSAGTLTATNQMSVVSGGLDSQSTTIPAISTSIFSMSAGGVLYLNDVANLEMDVSGNWSNSGGTFKAGNSSLVYFNGTTQTANISGTNQFYNFSVGGTSATTFLDSSILNVAGAMNVYGVLSLGKGDHSASTGDNIYGTLNLLGTGATTLSDLTANGNFTVASSGILNLKNASALYAASNIIVAVHGTLSTPAGTTIKPLLMNAVTGQRFNFYTDGTVNINGLYFSGAWSNATSKGFEIRPGATLQALNNVDFRNVDNNGGSGGVHIYLSNTYSTPNNYTFTISNPTFDTSFEASAAAATSLIYAIAAVSYNVYSGTPAYTATITMSNPLWSDGVTQISDTIADVYDFDYDSAEKGADPNGNQEILTWQPAFVWIGTTNTIWNTSTNWLGGNVPPNAPPPAAHDVIIQSSAPNYPILNDNAYMAGLTIQSGAQLNLGAAAYNIYAAGTISMQASSSQLYFSSGYTGYLEMNGATQAISVPNAGTKFQIYQLIIASTNQTEIANNINVGTSSASGGLQCNSGTLKVDSNVQLAVYSNTTLSGGTVDLSSSGSTLLAYASVANNAGSTITFGASGTGALYIYSLVSSTFTSAGAFTAGNGTVQITGTINPLPVVTFYNLNLIGASTAYTVTLGGNTTCNGSVTIGSSTTLDVSASNWGLNVGGNWTLNGTFTQRSGTVTFNGSSGTQNINNPTTFYNLTIADASATTYYNGAWSSTSYLTIQGKLTVSGGTLDLGQGRTGSMAHQVTYNTNPSVEVSGGTLKLNTSELLATGSSAGLKIDGGTVSMTSVVATTYYALYIYGQVQMTSGTLDSTGASAQMYVAGAWDTSVGGTFNIGTSDITLAGSTAQNITTKGTTSGDFYNVDLNATATKTLGGTTYIANNITMDSGAGANVLAGGVNIYVAGNWNDVPGNSFNNAGAAVYFNGSGAQTISAESFAKMIVNKSGGTATANGALTASNLLLVQAGTLDLATYTHTASGTSYPSVQVTGGTLKFSTATLNVSGSGGGVDITGGTADMTGGATTMTITGDFKLEGGTLSMGASAGITENGNWTFSSGTFNVGGTVTFAPPSLTTKTISNTSGATVDFANVVINGASGTAISQLSNDIILSGNLTLTAGTLNAGGAVNIYVAGNWSEAGSVFANASTTVYFNGTSGTQSVSAETFNAVKIYNTGTSVLAGGKLYMSSLAFEKGTLDLGTSVITHVVTGAVNILPSPTYSANLKFNTGGAMTMYSNLTIGNNGTLTMTTNNAADPLDIYGDFTINSGGTLNLGTTNTATITARGNWTQNGGTINVADTTLSMTGSSKTITVPAGSYPASPNFYNLTTAGSVTAATGIYLFNNLVVNAGASFTANSGSTGLTHYVNGSATVNASASAAGGYLNLNNSALVFTAAYGAYTNVLTVNSNTNNGQLVMYAASGLYFANYNKMLVNGSIACYVNGGAVANITHLNSTDRYAIVVNGPFYLDNMIIQYYDANGFQLGDETASNILNLSTAGVAYMNAVKFEKAYAVGAAAYHNSIMGNVKGSATFTSCSWDNTYGATGHNIQARLNISGAPINNSSMPTITLSSVVTIGSDGSGQSYDIEAFDSPDHLVWIISSNWIGVNSTKWGDPGNWSNGVPASTTNAIIPHSTSSGNMPTVVANGIYQCYNLTMNSGSPNSASLIVNGTLDIYGNLVINGGVVTVNLSPGGNLYIGGTITDPLSEFTNTTKQSGGGSVIFNGTAQQALQQGLNVYDLEISNTTLVDNGYELQIYDSLTVDSGKTLTLSGDAATASKLYFASGAGATISGTFATSFSGSDPVPIVSSAVPSNTYTFNLNGGVNIYGLAFSYGQAGGMYINTAATFTSFADIYFNNAASGYQHLSIVQNGGRLNANSVFFDISPNGTNNAKTGANNIYVNDAAGGFKIVIPNKNDTTSASGTVRGVKAAGSSNNGTGQAVWVDSANIIAGADSANGGFQGLIIHGTNYSYALIRRTSDDYVVQMNRATGKAVGTYDLSASTYGHIVGRPMLIESGGADNIFFGTNSGYIFRIGQDLSVYSNYPDNLGGFLTQVMSPVISDVVWGGGTVTGGDNIYFCAENALGVYAFYGLDINATQAAGIHAYVNTASDPTDGTSAGDPFPRYSLSYPIVSEPSIDVLTLGGTNQLVIFMSSLYDNTATTGEGHIWRFSKKSSANDHTYIGTSATAPNSDIKAPVNEYVGRLTVASTDTAATGGGPTPVPRVYFIESDIANSLIDYNSNWPVAAGYGIEYGVDNDYGAAGGSLGGTIAYGTKGGYFSIRPFNFTNSFGNETYYNGFPTTALDGGKAITTYPVFDVNSTYGNVYYFGTANGKVYKMTYGGKEGQNTGFLNNTGTYDGQFIYTNNISYNAITSTQTPFLDIGAGDKISAMSFNGTELYVTTADGEIYTVPSGD